MLGEPLWAAFIYCIYIYTCLSDLWVHAHSYAQGLGVAYQPYARASTMVVFKFVIKITLPLWDLNPRPI